MESFHTSSYMASRGLKSITQLAEDRGHGDRIRYLAGCRCRECRDANNAYAKSRKLAQADGDWNGVVSAERARSHLQQLSQNGVGRLAVAEACDMKEPFIGAIATGRKKRIRARTEKAILAVTTAAAFDGALVPAGPTWAILNKLVREGYSKRFLAAQLGQASGRIQFSKDRVTVRNAYMVERLAERLRKAPDVRAVQRLKQLAQNDFCQNKVTPDSAFEQALVPAAPSWVLIEKLIRDGYSKRFLALQLGRKNGQLQLGKDKVSVRNAYEITRQYERLHKVPAARAVRDLQHLADEGYTRTQIEHRAELLAQDLSMKVPDLAVDQALITHETEQFISRLHFEMTR